MSKRFQDRAQECRISVTDLHAIEHFAKRISKQLAEKEIPLPLLVQALIHKGLDLADTHELEPDHLASTDQARTLRFAVTDEDCARLEHHLKRFREHAASCSLPQVHRATLRLGLREAARSASFPAFCQVVLLALLSRSPR